MSSNTRDQEIQFVLCEIASNGEDRREPVSGYLCPCCGYDLRGSASVAAVRCPECGHTAQRGELLTEPPPAIWVSLIAIGTKITVVLGGLIIVFLIVAQALTSSCRCRSPDLLAKIQLTQIHQA